MFIQGGVHKARHLPTRSCSLLLHWGSQTLMSSPEMLLGGGEGGPGGSDCSGSIWKVLSHHAVWCTHNTVSLQGMTSTISQALTFSDQGQRGCRTSLQPIRADGDPCLGGGDPPILRTTWGYLGQLLSSLVFTAGDPATGRWGRCDEGTGGSLHLDQLHSVAHVSMQDK